AAALLAARPVAGAARAGSGGGAALWSAPEAWRAFKDDPAGLATTAWALARRSVRDQPLLARVAAGSLARIAEFQPRHLSITAWSFARLSVADGPLLAAISQAALGSLEAFKPRDLAHFMWSFARLEVVHEPLRDAIA
ncbi:unnamed protein product, partial [Prorocentrum cordatum]